MDITLIDKQQTRTFNGEEITIGRGANCNFKIPEKHKDVSRDHAVVTLENDTISITDRSKNGTLVEDKFLGKGESFQTKESCRIQIGRDYLIDLVMGDVGELTLLEKTTAMFSKN